ncbi:MAG: hypothetical protein WBW84_18710 [Acidobacteriaceae bacterium]
MFNPADLSPSPAPDHRCRFVKVNGARCRYPSKPGSDLCGDHHHKKLFTRGRLRPSPPATFNTVPLVRFAWAEDHDSILFNCNQIALALVHSTISTREAGTLNALMHTAQRSLHEKFLHERFEARERERSPNSTPNPAEDIVTDYVLDTDGMPLALPDEPTHSGEPTNPGESTDPGEPTVQGDSDPVDSDPVDSDLGAPSLSSRAVREDRVGSPDPDEPTDPGDSDPGAPHLASFARCGTANDPTPDPSSSSPEVQEDNPEGWDAHTITVKRDAILYLRDYYKNDPKMLAEIETYPGARYAPKPKFEPEHEPVTLPTLTASAAPDPLFRNPYPLSPLLPAHNPNPCRTCRQRPPRSALFLTHNKIGKQKWANIPAHQAVPLETSWNGGRNATP